MGHQSHGRYTEAGEMRRAAHIVLSDFLFPFFFSVEFFQERHGPKLWGARYPSGHLCACLCELILFYSVYLVI